MQNYPPSEVNTEVSMTPDRVEESKYENFDWSGIWTHDLWIGIPTLFQGTNWANQP